MKKILIAVAILASMQVANAQQVKSAAQAKSAVEAAQKAADDAKKSTKVATWLKLGQALVDAYESPAGAGWIGASKTELQLIMGGEKPVSTEQVTVGGQPMTKEVYDTKNYYFNAAGQLAIREITKPVMEDALDRAVAAYKKAASIDNGSKAKDITAGVQNVNGKLVDAAYAAYQLGDLAKASSLFEKAYQASGIANAPLDTNSLYNVGFTAWQGGKYEAAKASLEKCLSLGYAGEGGEAYAKLADCCDKLGDKATAKNTLEQGFAKFPQSQSLLVGLINYYVTSGEDSNRLFQLLDGAKKNEPNNASLYYVEGNIHKQLGQIEEAIASYDQCSKVDPKYAYGLIGKGILYYEQAVAIQEKAANEMDDNKYAALVADFEKSLKSCIAPFEAAFELTQDAALKSNIAEYLKNAFYRFRTESAENTAKYEKYSAAAAQ